MGSEDAEDLRRWGCRDIGMQKQGHRGAGTHGCKDSEMQGNRDALCGVRYFRVVRTQRSGIQGWSDVRKWGCRAVRMWDKEMMGCRDTGM